MRKRPKQDMQWPEHILIDPEPDERGNVLVGAQFDSGQIIALTFNAN